MRQVNSPKSISPISWGIGIATIAFLTYPVTIAQTVGKDLPSGWSPKLGKLTFSAIYKEIGPPELDMSAKEYQGWAEYHWWGVKMLKIASHNCCVSQAHPSHIQYLVYVKGRDDPVVNEFIFEDVD